MVDIVGNCHTLADFYCNQSEDPDYSFSYMKSKAKNILLTLVSESDIPLNVHIKLIGYINIIICTELACQ